MTSIHFELQTDDFVAFNMQFLHSSAAIGRQRRTYRLALAGLTTVLAFVVIGIGFGDLVGGGVVALVSGLVIWLIAPALWFREAKKNLDRMGSSDGLGSVGAHTLTMDDVGLKEVTPRGETSASWASIDRIEETNDHVFIFFGPVQAFVIPKRIGEREVAEFLNEVRGRCGQ